MSVLVKTPHTKFEIKIKGKGKLPMKLKKWLISEYGQKNVCSQNASDDQAVNFRKTDWWKNRSRVTPSRRIKAYRGRDGLTQAELGQLLGKSKHFVCDLEHERRGISKEIALKLSKIFKTSVERFIS